VYTIACVRARARVCARPRACVRNRIISSSRNSLLLSILQAFNVHCYKEYHTRLGLGQVVWITWPTWVITLPWCGLNGAMWTVDGRRCGWVSSLLLYLDITPTRYLHFYCKFTHVFIVWASSWCNPFQSVVMRPNCDLWCPISISDAVLLVSVVLCVIHVGTCGRNSTSLWGDFWHGSPSRMYWCIIFYIMV